jgi:hypothetical protein
MVPQVLKALGQQGNPMRRQSHGVEKRTINDMITGRAQTRADAAWRLS